MDDEYTIIDNRGCFKKTTFSGYKKLDVYMVLNKSMETKKVENTNNWITECICSLYIEELWNNLLLFAFKIININNPSLPLFLYNKNMIFYNIYNNLNLKDLFVSNNLRNNQIIRNLFTSVSTILTISSKNKRYDKYPKFKDVDFNFEIIQKRLTVNTHLLPNDLIHFDEPEELKVIMNEIYYHLKNKIGGYEKSLYWILWIIEWEKRNIKAKNEWKIDYRKVNVKEKFKNDLMWIIWDVIMLEANNRSQFIKRQIKALYELYIFQFTSRKKNKRIAYIVQSICYLTHNIDESIKLVNNPIVLIQVQCGNNLMYKSKKIHEQNNIIKDKISKLQLKPKSQAKAEKKMNEEKIKSKIDLFNDLDVLNNI